MYCQIRLRKSSGAGTQSGAAASPPLAVKFIVNPNYRATPAVFGWQRDVIKG